MINEMLLDWFGNFQPKTANEKTLKSMASFLMKEAALSGRFAVEVANGVIPAEDVKQRAEELVAQLKEKHYDNV